MTIAPRPAVQPAPDWAFPTPAETVLDNGLRVLTVDIPGQYVLSVRVGIPLPPATEPRDREGLVLLLSRTFDEGTLDHDAATFAEMLERSGAALGAGTTEYGLTLECDVPRTRLADGLELFSEALNRPAFPGVEVERAVKRRLADIEQEDVDPRHRAAREFAASFYTPQSRASRPTGGTRETVARITADDIRTFYADHVGPIGATVTIAGDLGDADEVARLVAATLGQWRPQPHPVSEPQVPERRDDAARVIVLDRPEAVQTEIYLGALAPARTSPQQWAPYPVLSFLLGGAPQARIDAVLREEKGYTYGIRAGVASRNGMSVFITSGSVRSEVTGDAVRLLLGILRTSREGFTPAELRSGVDFVSKTAPARYATADSVADELVHLALEGRSGADITLGLRATRELDLPGLDAAAQQIDLDHLTVVLVGAADVIVEQLTAAGMTDVEVRAG